MAAITADTLTLPRVAAPAPSDTERPVRSITTGPRGHEGEGFPVVRAFAGVSAAELDPFVHLDQMGEIEYQPGEARGTDWHPHRGFETVTYMIDGTFAHQDSHGGGGLIGDSPDRIAFLRTVIDDAPADWIETDGYRLIYFGERAPARHSLELGDDDHRIDVIDTWQMTVTELPGRHRGSCTVELGRPDLAVRVRRVDPSTDSAEQEDAG